MSRTLNSDAMQEAIERLGSAFEKRPLDFFAESDLQSRLAEYLRIEFDDRGDLFVSYPGNQVMGGGPMVFNDERVKTASFNNWIENRVKDKATSSTDHHLTRVHTEVYADEQFGLDSDNRLDIAILSTSQSSATFRPLIWEEGRQKASVESMSGGVELKILRSRTDFRQKIGDIDPVTASISEIADGVELSFNGIQKDLAKSDQLGGEYANLDMVFVLMSNYDCLYRGSKSDLERQNYDLNRKIGNAVIEAIDQKYGDMAVYYSSPIPGSSQWLI